jgi:hypothetical protein
MERMERLVSLVPTGFGFNVVAIFVKIEFPLRVRECAEAWWSWEP